MRTAIEIRYQLASIALPLLKSHESVSLFFHCCSRLPCCKASAMHSWQPSAKRHWSTPPTTTPKQEPSTTCWAWEVRLPTRPMTTTGDALVDDAFGRRARGAGASVSGAKGWAVLDDALLPSVAARIRDAAAQETFKPHKFVYDAQTYAKPGVAEVDLAEGTCADALANDLRGVAEALAPALAVPAAFSTPTRPSRFSATRAARSPATTTTPAAVEAERDGRAVLRKGGRRGRRRRRRRRAVPGAFSKTARRLRPLMNRLVLFKSDRVLHSVERWRGASPRLCVSFWFEGPVNAPEDLVLTRDRLRFSGWDAAAEFFMSSPVQRRRRAPSTPERLLSAQHRVDAWDV